jgi:glutamate formiminotransferase
LRNCGRSAPYLTYLVPAAALVQTAEYYLQLEGFRPAQVLEARLRGD